MTGRTLKDCYLLVVEDEYLVAQDLCQELRDAGAVVIGPAPSVGRALALIETEARVDGAVLDVNLGGDLVFPVADALVRRSVPFVFTTGYDAGALPERFHDVARCEKPVEATDLTSSIGQLIQA